MLRNALLAATLAVVALSAAASPITWSPDGKQVAAAFKDGVAVAAADGSGGWTLAGPGGKCPVWSPDGGSIVYSLPGNGVAAAWVFDVKKGRTRKVAAEVGPPYAWREDGQRFVGFSRLPEGAVEAVWYNLTDRGVTQRRALPCAAVQEDSGDVVWLPETDDIAFVGRDGAQADVYIVESGDVTRVTRTGDIIGFALSRDRKELVWGRRGPNPKYILATLYALNLESRGSRRLPLPDRIPLLNPNPRQAPLSVSRVIPSAGLDALAVMVAMPTAGAQTSACWVGKIDGSGSLVRSWKGATGGVALTWSPDGRRVALFDGTVTLVGLDGSQSKLPAR
ncbi:MAG: hypothetical protein NT029_01780 [Armatimonadetes bacterium]|nr:hypothetical protein [Armatimonadota bacterium]